jgi:hypothetical protein
MNREQRGCCSADALLQRNIFSDPAELASLYNRLGRQVVGNRPLHGRTHEITVRGREGFGVRLCSMKVSRSFESFSALGVSSAGLLPFVR